MSTTAIHPIHYRVIKRVGTHWHVKGTKLNSSLPIGLKDVGDYGITVQEVFISLFRINGGSSGYYLANLKNKKYYYCGPKSEDVKTTLHSLGIGRVDPMGG